MAQYTVTLTEISAEMLDELANFAHTAWGRTDILDVEVIPGMGTTRAPLGAVEMAIPDPVPSTSSISIIIPPEPVDTLVEDVSPRSRGRKA